LFSHCRRWLLGACHIRTLYTAARPRHTITLRTSGDDDAAMKLLLLRRRSASPKVASLKEGRRAVACMLDGRPMTFGIMS
ncbi:MAG TPA: hypothetical protein VHV77_10585, partial [Pirellulales bacterium]|nr:hypothetical protein [Pirellulales bacterium]